MSKSNCLTEVTIVIPQFGQPDMTLACLKSLRQHELKKCPVIVVDDGSEAEDVDWLRQRLPERVRVVTQKQQGVTAAWNRGAMEVSTEFVLFLNNDVLFHGCVLESLFLPFKRSLLNRDEQVRVVGVRGRRERVLPRSWKQDGHSLHLLEGWAFGCQVEDFFQLGGFDEQMELYFSDTDFQLRMMEEYGCGCLKVVDGLPLEHLGHRTAHKLLNRNEKWRRDRDVFFQKWAERPLGKQVA